MVVGGVALRTQRGVIPPPQGQEPVAKKQKRAKAPFPVQRLVLALISMAGVLVLLFPTAANWFSSLGYDHDYAAYAANVDAMDPAEVQRLLEGARQYNANLPGGPLRDPYLINESGEVVDIRDDLADYEAQLSFGPDQPMGWIHVPSQGIDLPIFHGTDPKTLDEGAGHLHGSGLPVGGESNHSVITAHSGRPTANLFTKLHDMKKGDEFYSDVLGERFYYRVDQISIVSPDTGDLLKQVAGEDYITLLTCTPVGINTNRLLVRGVRIPTPETFDDGRIETEGLQLEAPWWAAVVVGVPLAVWFLLRRVDRKNEEKAAEAAVGPLRGRQPKDVSGAARSGETDA